MKFECGDLERAFANPDLMPEARAHLKTCAACRQEYRLWTEISSAATELRVDWETPNLWPQIRKSLEAEQKPAARPLWKNWHTWAIAAALFMGVSASLVLIPRHQPATITARRQDRDFLTEQALREVEKNEAAYRKSIDQLTRLAQPKIENASATAVNAREKLLMLDAAIADTRGNVASNRFNTHLQTTLAELYREKQQTLKELLTSAKNN